MGQHNQNPEFLSFLRRDAQENRQRGGVCQIPGGTGWGVRGNAGGVSYAALRGSSEAVYVF